MGKREENKIAKSQASVRDMVDAVTAGDLSAAGDAFEALVSAKRDHEWVNAKHDLARTAFEYETVVAPEVDPTPVDTGITGDPAEVEEEYLDEVGDTKAGRQALKGYIQKGVSGIRGASKKKASQREKGIKQAAARIGYWDSHNK